MLLHPDKTTLKYLKDLHTDAIDVIALPDSAVDAAEAEVRLQHPDEPFPRERAIARLAHHKYGSSEQRTRKEQSRTLRLLKLCLGSVWLVLALLLALAFFSLKAHSQTTSVDVKRVGGTLVVGSIPVDCVSGCSAVVGAQDINFLEYLGVTPSATNGVATQLTNGAAFYDGRDRAWTLDSGTDSVTIFGSISNTTFAATQGTSPWVISGAVTTSGTATVSGTVTADQGAAGLSAWLVDGSGFTQPVSGTFWQATQPVSGAFFQATQPISAVALPLPTGASTEAKQPALGTAGAASADVITVQGIAAMTPLLVDGSAVTQPVSGTVTVTDGAGALNVIVDSGILTTVSTVTNLSQLAGAAISMNTGVRDAGTQRVTIATNDLVPVTDGAGALNTIVDSGTITTVTTANLAAETTKVIGTVRNLGNVGGVFDTTQNAAVAANSLLVGCNFTASPATLTTANQGAVQCNSKGELLTQLTDGTTNVAVIAGTTALKTDLSSVAGTATVAASAGVQKVGIVGNAGAAVDSATGAAPPANAVLVGGLGSGATNGLVIAMPICDTQAVVNISTITTTLVVTGVSGRHVRICAFSLLTAAANNVAFLSGTGATCGTGTAGMSGGTTAASGYNFAANGGIATGSGLGTVLKTVAAGDSVCVITSATTQLSGQVSYTIY